MAARLAGRLVGWGAAAATNDVGLGGWAADACGGSGCSGEPVLRALGAGGGRSIPSALFHLIARPAHYTRALRLSMAWCGVVRHGVRMRFMPKCVMAPCVPVPWAYRTPDDLHWCTALPAW